MTDHAYNAQRARTRAADAQHATMKQWYAKKLDVEYDKAMAAIARLSKKEAEQLYREWLNESSS